MAETELHTSLEQQIRVEFETALNAASTEDEKKTLFEEILQEILDILTSAKELADEAEVNGANSVPEKNRQKGKDAASPILKLYHFIKKTASGDIDTAIFEGNANLSSVQRIFLKKLLEDKQSMDSAAFLSSIVGKYIDKGNNYLVFSADREHPTEFEKDLMKVAKNRVVLTSIRSALEELCQTGNLKTNSGIVIHSDDLKVLLDSLEEKMLHTPISQADVEKLARRGNDVIRRVYDKAKPVMLGYKEAIDEAVQRKDQIRTNANIPDQEKVDQLEAIDRSISRLNNERIQFDSKIDSVVDYLGNGRAEGIFAHQEDPEGSIMEFISNTLTIEAEEFEELRDIRRRYVLHIKNNGLEKGQGELASYDKLVAEINQYTGEAIFNRIWQDGRLNKEAVEDIKNEIEIKTSALFQPLYDDPRQEFNEAFNPYIEGTIFKNITTRLRSQVDGVTERIEKEAINQGKDYSEARKFAADIRDSILKDKIVGELERRKSIETIVHRYQQVGAVIGLEDLRKTLSTYDITLLQEFLRDDLTALISDFMPQFIQQLFLENGNRVISDLFQILQEQRKIRTSSHEDEEASLVRAFSLRYKDEFIKYSETILTKLYEDGTLKSMPKRELIDARFSRAYLDNFLLSLRGVKVISRAIPERGFKDVPYMEISRIFNPKHRWGKLGSRGRGPKGAGDAETYEISGMRGLIYDEEGYVKEWIPKHGNLSKSHDPQEEMKVAKSRVLYGICPSDKELMKDLETRKWDYVHNMNDVYQGMAFGNIIDQAGWPFNGFNEERRPKLYEELKQYFRDKDPDFYERYESASGYDDLSWDDKFDLHYRTVGVIPAFWLIYERAGKEAKEKFLEYLAFDSTDKAFVGKRKKEVERLGREMTAEDRKVYLKKFSNSLGTEKFDSLLDKYTADANRFDKVIKVSLDGVERDVTVRDYMNKRMQILRGEVFFQLLKKDPQAWLGELGQMLMHESGTTNVIANYTQGYVVYEKIDGSKSNPIPYSEFYFNLEAHPDSALSDKWKEERDRFRFRALTVFRGKNDNVLSNVPHLKKILDFYTRLADSYLPDGTNITADNMDTIKEAAKKGAREFAMQSQYARRKAVSKNESEINPEDMRVLSASNLPDNRLHDVMYDGNGLLTHFVNHVGPNRNDYFGDGDRNLGSEFGFFQRYGRSFDMDNRHHSLPEGDTNMPELLGTVNDKQTLERRMGTDEAFVKAQDVFDKIPSACQKASSAKNMDEWYGVIEEELHSKIKVIAEEDQALEQQYQFEIFMAVTKFFTKNSKTLPLLTGWFYDIKLGKKKSMSTIKLDYTQGFTLDLDKTYIYLRKLRERRYLKAGYSLLGGFGLDLGHMASGATLLVNLGRQAVIVATMAPVIVAGGMVKEAYEKELGEEQ